MKGNEIFNSAYSPGETVMHLFEKQAVNTPDHIALIFEDNQLTYKELDEKSNQLAHYLITQGVSNEMLVPICVSRSIEMIIGIFAIMKAGGAYVPIDPNHPESRIATILEDCAGSMILTQQTFKSGLLSDHKIRTIALDTEGSLWENASKLSLNRGILADQLAYVIYTSGTTGKPKGVMIEHGALHHYCSYFKHYFGLKDSDRILNQANFSFDASIEEIFPMLLSGGSVVLSAFGNNIENLFSECEKHSISILSTNPYVLEYLNSMEDYTKYTFRILISGGDTLKANHVNHIRTAFNIYNTYGPTENTICSTYYFLEESKEIIPIGKPLANTEAYIFDSDLKLVPLGVAGELFLGGVQLSRGYLNRPELTAEKFISHPFKEGERLYRTGDLARWLADGNIEFIGRNDDQVKIRGYRIELGEIESELDRMEGIQQSVVLAIGDGASEKQLVAYYVSAAALGIDDLKNHLKAVLPEYMVPKVYMHLDSLPLTVNGKIDRRALPMPDARAYEKKEYVSPQTSTEKILVKIWSDVLSLDADNIGLYDDFFDLGGHSLKATRLSNQISKHLGVQLALTDLFRYSVLQDQALLIDNSQKTVLASIPQSPVQADYPLSSSQKRMWILSQFEAGNVAYSIPSSHHIHGSLDLVSLEESFRRIVSRHEILRTVFRLDEHLEARQYILSAEAFEFNIDYRDLRGIDLQEDQVRDYIYRESVVAFDLSHGPLLRLGLFRLGDEDYVLNSVMHHIISDAWSMEVMVRELMLLYNGLSQGRDVVLPGLNLQYRDYSVWQQDNLQNGSSEKHARYWQEQFTSVPGVLDLPTDYLRPVVKTYNGAVYNKLFSSTLTQGLKDLVHESGSTLFMGLLGMLNVLFYRYTGQKDIVLGTSVAGRNHPDLEDQIGFYINTLALRTRFEGGDSFRMLLDKVKATVFAGLEHQDYPFDELVESLSLATDLSRNPLFDVIVTLQNADIGNNQSVEGMQGLNFSSSDAAFLGSIFDMTFNFEERGDVLSLSLMYNTDLFSSERISHLGDHLEHLLGSILGDADLQLNSLDYIPANEVALLEQYNTSQIREVSPMSIVSLFRRQCGHTPDRIALSFNGHDMSYAELDSKSDQLAHYLLSSYELDGPCIGLLLDKSPLLLIGILGILKSGRGYLPIDINTPDIRRSEILSDSGCSVLLSHTDYLMELSSVDVSVMYLDIELDNAPAGSIASLADPSWDDLAYVMYTSGTTGRSKGVMVSHGSVVSLVRDVDYVSFTSDQVILSTGSVSFDATTFEYWGALLNGGRLVLCSREVLLDPVELESLILSQDVTMMWFTSGWFNELVEHSLGIFSGLQIVLVGGDRLSPIHIARVGSAYPDLTLINGYGPTENTTFSLTHKISSCDPSDTVPIGLPFTNRGVYILDANMNLVGHGVMGELYLFGAGLSQGYLGDSVLTAEKFIPHPFKEGERLYRTGDLGRWNYGGYVEFMGRNDDQVKIRGYRIELDDVVLGLLSHDKINNAVVIAYGDTEGSRELIGYYTSDDFINVRELRSYLSERLPSYMIPGYYSQLDELPLTSNGKVDRKALALISHLELDTGTEYKAPVTTAEKILVEIWSEVLSIPQEKIGVNDNFFDLGGDSIKIIRLISPIKKQFSKKIEVVNFYKNPTISGLSILINAKDLILEESENLVLSLIEKKLEDLNTEVFLIEKHENAIGMKVLPMSDIQLGMVATSELMREEGEKGIYHDQMVLELGPVNLDIMTQALRLLIAKHEILRTSFNLYDYSIPVQFIHDRVKVTIHDNDISTLPPDEQKEYIYKFLKEERENNPFQMDLPSLFRLHIIKIAEKKNVLVFQFHHAILDGWSDKNFRVELLNTYSQLEKDLNYELLPLSVGLKDSIVSDFIESKNQHHIAYWKEELADYKRLDILSNEVHYDQLEYVYSIPFYNTLLEQCKSDKISLKTLFFAGYLYILKMLSVSNDITIGLVSNRRPIEEDGDKLLGCFLNTVPFRLQLESDIMQTLRTFLKYVDTKLEKLKGRDRFSLVEISKLHLEHYHANPFFDVLYNYVDFHNISDKFENSENANSNNLALESFDKTNTYLDFAVSVTSNVLSVSLTQGRFLRSGQTLNDLKMYLDNFLKAYINSPESQLTNEILISVEDRKELLETFNDTKVSYPEGESVVSLFEKQAAATPGHMALVFEGSQLTYQELNEKSNQLAYYLTSLGVTKETLVPICFERSTELIIGILAILKAGGAYVPVDPNYPESRIETILEDCSATVILTQHKQKSGLLSGQKVRAIALDTEQALWENASKLPLGQEITEDQLAYVIYTSGTTGKPKGVMIEHGNLYNFLKSIESSIFKDISVRLLNITSSTFDISLLEYFIPLILGGELILIKDEDLEDANQLVSKIDEYKPNVIQCTPSRWQILKEVDWSCDFDLKILCGGEYLSKDLKAYLLKNSTGCWNLYGPTETTIWSTITAIEDGVNSIGKPIANTDVYILDPELKLVPKGVVGELYIGGKGLSRGYLNRPELTKEKFIAHPFKEGEGLYKTGDLARWLPEEGIEFIGRKDDQVKIRGYRIELGEIASQLDTVEGIRQSVVLALGSGGSERQLVAYYVSDQAFDIEELKNHLKITLPEYMIPKIYMHMECFALMVNGKIDRKALPMPDAAAYQKKQYAAPQTPMEKILVEIWQELLDIEQIGIHDNFFDLGGNSLLVIRLKAIIVKRFNLDLNVSVIFKLNDVKNIAEYLGLLLDKQEFVDNDNEKDVLFF